MDIIMPEMDGIAATAAIKQRWPEIEVVALTSFIEEDKIHGALQAGAIGISSRMRRQPKWRRRFERRMRGSCVSTRRSLGAWRNHCERRSTRAGRTADGPGERSAEVGGTGKGEQRDRPGVGIGDRTVRTHVTSILGKLAWVSRTQAAIYAVREGLVDEPGMSFT